MLKEKPLYTTAPLYPLALRKHIGNFGWKDKSAPVVAFYKLYYDFSSLLGEIFMKKVTGGGKHL